MSPESPASGRKRSRLEPGAPGIPRSPTPPPPAPVFPAPLARRPRLRKPRSAAGQLGSRAPRRQGHGGAAGSEPRPGVPETSEQAPYRAAAAAAAATSSPAGLRAGPWMKGSTSGC